MAHTDHQPHGFGAMLRDLRTAIGEMLGGGKLEPEQAATVEVVFGLLGYLAGADSIVTTHEAEFTNQLMDELNLSTRARDLAHEAFARGRKREIEINVEINRFLSIHPKGSTEAKHLHDSLYRLAAADGRLMPREKIVLDQITAALGFAAK